MIYLRAADGFDTQALAELRAASLIEIDVLPSGNAAAFIPQAARAFRLLFAAERIVAWLACDGDSVVGSSCAVYYDRLPYPDGSRHAELCGVYVMPAYRNRGFASELVREVVATTRATARKTFLRPSSKAKGLYERLGFVETELMTLGAPCIAANGPSQRTESAAWTAHESGSIRSTVTHDSNGYTAPYIMPARMISSGSSSGSTTS